VAALGGEEAALIIVSSQIFGPTNTRTAALVTQNSCQQRQSDQRRQ
jgi:hypothetical protein